ncbi:MAG: competence/damage-inducible protein A [Phycisphaeraceae bacterium]|nr:competence/damage-inducible protein A [Phycisphaeraceae bacterium]
MQAIILSIGDELVLGQTVDTNSAYLSGKLAELGIGTVYHATVADDQDAIARAILRAAKDANLVLISGGLGPTEDDLTRQALAQAMGVGLVEHAESIKAIEQRMMRAGRTMPPRNRVQALHPEGSNVIENTCGTAPGIHARIGDAEIFVTPGVPKELYVMFERSILPRLDPQQATRQVILTTKVNTFGLGESAVAERLGDLADRNRNPVVGTTVSQATVAVRIRSEFEDGSDARRQLDDTIRAVEHRLGALVFGRDDTTIQQSLVSLLAERGLIMATAESCTGGLIGKMVTDVPGSSDVYHGGWVTYSYAAKSHQLGVPEALLQQHGAVCEPVAEAMATGALERSGADLALAITGIAGPGGGSEAKPVGTVWIALADRTSGDAPHVMAVRFVLPGDRESVRQRSAKCALQMARFHLLGISLDELHFGRR